MKSNVLLLVDADGDCKELASAAAARNGWEAQWAKTSREAFALLKHYLRNFTVVLIDVDPGSHGLALLEAVSSCGERPPMIVLSALEESYMNAIACEHGAALCLSKPISPSGPARLCVAFIPTEFQPVIIGPSRAGTDR